MAGRFFFGLGTILLLCVFVHSDRAVVKGGLSVLRPSLVEEPNKNAAGLHISPEQCGLQCNHGGTPNSACTTCENCAGAWRGRTCDTWDASVSSDVVLEDLRSLRDRAENATKAAGLFKRGALPRLSIGLGQGVDVTTGISKLPILAMDYPTSAGGSTWTSPNARTTFQLPNGISVAPSSVQGSSKTLTFQGMYDYVQYLYGFEQTNVVEAPPGSFSAEIQEDLVALKRKYFSGSSFITVTKEIFPVLDVQFSGYQMKLDNFAARALAALPPDYSSVTNKAIYRTFIDYWGTHAISSSTVGGMLDLQSFVQQTLLTGYQGPFTTQGITQQANTDYYRNVWGTGSYDSNASKYLSGRTLGQLSCKGGNAAEYCSPAQDNWGDSSKLQNWKNTVADNPVPLRYSLTDFTSLLPEPQRSNIRQAIQDFMTEQRNKWTVNFPSCPECMWGTCTQGETVCTCYNNHITGIACDQCVNGWINKMCQTPVCRTPCNPTGGACVAPDKCQCFYPYRGTYCYPTCGDGIVQWPEECEFGIGYNAQCCLGCMINYGSPYCSGGGGYGGGSCYGGGQCNCPSGGWGFCSGGRCSGCW